jgi:hypothetical protein
MLLPFWLLAGGALWSRAKGCLGCLLARKAGAAMPVRTSVDSEEMAYPSGGIRAGRRGRVQCPDGVVRTVLLGVPDTFFSIPASLCYRGTRVAGFVSIASDGSGEYCFTPYSYRKNGNIFAGAARGGA